MTTQSSGDDEVAVFEEQPQGPVRWQGSLLCACGKDNQTYCAHMEDYCPWFDREPVNPIWRKP